MTWIFLSIIVLIFGLICILIGHYENTKTIDCSKSWNWDYSYEKYYWIGIPCVIISGTILFIMILVLTLKPVMYKNFKIKYDTIKEMSTSPDDIRDATYTQNLIEINNEIRHCREYKNSTWVGIFQNKKICNLKLLNK